MTAHFEFDRMKDGRVCFVLIAEDGAVIARSAPFASESEAREAARLARDARLLDSENQEERSPEDQARIHEALKLIRQRGRAIVQGRAHSLDHDALLYDEYGLPK